MSKAANLFGAKELIVTKDKTIRRASDLSPDESLQLSWLVAPFNVHKKVAFGNPKDILSIEDCFNRRNVDDGIVFYKEMVPAVVEDVDAEVRFHYWLGYFGGNPIGYLLTKSDCLQGQDSEECLDNDEKWAIVIENCDGDFIWRGKGENTPKSFIKAVKKAAYGSKYSED
ncbi:MAG: hypothetical protein SGILL_010218 [Bacillariaceae sp.]